VYSPDCSIEGRLKTVTTLNSQADKYQVAFDFLMHAPREWEARMEDFTPADRAELVLLLEAIMEKSALTSAYLSTRVSGGSHESAVAEANKRCTAARKAIGFTFPESDLKF
jgi:uncharacterized protein YllA (UPF0747 family)